MKNWQESFIITRHPYPSRIFIIEVNAKSIQNLCFCPDNKEHSTFPCGYHKKAQYDRNFISAYRARPFNL